MSTDQSGVTQVPRQRKPCVRIGCIILAVLAILLIIGIFAIRIIVKSRLTPEQLALIHEIDSEVVSLPDAWHRPATLPSSESIALAQSFNEEMNSILEAHDALLLGGPNEDYTVSLLGQRESGKVVVRPEQSTSYSLLLADFEPLIDETSRTVALPDYTVEADLYTTDTTSFLRMQSFAKICAVVANQQALAGDCIRAIDTAALPIRLMKRTEQASLITHLVGVAVAAISCHALDSISDKCSDTLTLEYGYNLLNELRTTAFPGNYKLWRYGDSIGGLQRAAANGYPADLSPQTMAEYYRQGRWLFTPHYYHWLIDNLPPSDSRVVVARARLAQYDEDLHNQMFKEYYKSDYTSKNSIMETAAELILGVDPYSLFYASLGPNNEEFETRAQTALAQYDLTRLRFAQRIAELKGEPIAQVLSDPFTSAPLSFSEKSKSFYSVGPDQKDDHTQIRYDSTNGTLSPGDIVLNTSLSAR